MKNKQLLSLTLAIASIGIIALLASPQSRAQETGHKGHDHAQHENDAGHDEATHEENANQAEHDEASHEGHDHDTGHDEATHEKHDDHAEHGVASHEEGDHDEHAESGDDRQDDHAEESPFLVIAPSDQKALGMEVAVANPATLRTEVTLPGEVKLNAETLAHVGPRYGGVVRQIFKRLGDDVKQGDLLAIIESNESLTNFRVTAPIDGTIVDYAITLGEAVESNKRIFAIADLSTVWVDLDVYQKDIASIKRGQPASIDAGHNAATAEGKITYTGPLVDEHTRTGLARVVIDNHDGDWRPGMFVTARVICGEFDVPLAVKLTAIQRMEGQPTVFVETDEGFVERQVELGRTNHKWIEVLKGLKPGERYASKRSFVLKAQKIKASIDPHAGHNH